MWHLKVFRGCAYVLCMLLLLGSGHCFADRLKARANVVDNTGKDVGNVIFTEAPGGPVTIEVSLHSFPPGVHAFHIHEKPFCELHDFESAGGHFNPYGKEHGFLNREGPHAGDLPNIIVDQYGNCEMIFLTDRITLANDKENSILREPGTSIMIHEHPDDYFTDPVGESGRRIACGVIKGVFIL